MRVLAALSLVALAFASCMSADDTSVCPGQFDPRDMSDTELKGGFLGRLPEQGATSEPNLRKVVEDRRGWIEENYPGVVEIGIDKGWGVTQSRDELGNITIHRVPDFMVITTVEGREACPDPDRGTLLIFDGEKRRVPVRFDYKVT